MVCVVESKNYLISLKVVFDKFICSSVVPNELVTREKCSVFVWFSYFENSISFTQFRRSLELNPHLEVESI